MLIGSERKPLVFKKVVRKLPALTLTRGMCFGIICAIHLKDTL